VTFREHFRAYAGRLSGRVLSLAFRLNQYALRGQAKTAVANQRELGLALQALRQALNISLEDLRDVVGENLTFAAQALENTLLYTIQADGTPLDHAERITAALFKISRSRFMEEVQKGVNHDGNDTHANQPNEPTSGDGLGAGAVIG
jgi:hypothetical protein